MSKTGENASALDESFTTKLGIPTVASERFMQLIEFCAHIPRAVIVGIGKPGIGKSQIVRQRARARNNGLGVPCGVMHIPQMSIEDFYIPTSASDTKRYYDKRIPRNFADVVEWVEKHKANKTWRDDMKPILVIEEINRASDKNVTKACFTIIEDRMIGDTKIPDEVQIVALMNPAGGTMMVNEFEKDEAFRRRLLFVGITSAFGSFIQYARKGTKSVDIPTFKASTEFRKTLETNFHPEVIKFLEAQTKWFYDDKMAAAGKVYANPASWETVSDICCMLQANNLPYTGQLAQAAIAGKVGMTATEAFMSYLKDNDSVIAAIDVLRDYRERSKIRERVLKQVENGKDGILTDLCAELATIMFDGSERKIKDYADQLALFMDDLPPERLMDFIKYKIANAADNYDGGRDYFKRLNVEMSTNSKFNSALKKYEMVRKKAEEAQEAEDKSKKKK